MGNWLLLVVMAFLLFMGIMGFKKGFINMMFSLIALIATIILSVIISPYVSEYLKKETPTYSTVLEKTSSFIEGAILKMEEEAGDSKTIEELPLPGIIKDKLKENNNEEAYLILGSDNLSDYISAYVANIIVNAIAFCATFLVILILLKILTYLLDLLSRLPLLNGMNRLLGLALGLIEGFLILWVLCLAVTASAGTAGGQEILEKIGDSEFLSFIYNNNYLVRIVTDALKIVFSTQLVSS